MCRPTDFCQQSHHTDLLDLVFDRATSFLIIVLRHGDPPPPAISPPPPPDICGATARCIHGELGHEVTLS